MPAAKSVVPLENSTLTAMTTPLTPVASRKPMRMPTTAAYSTTVERRIPAKRNRTTKFTTPTERTRTSAATRRGISRSPLSFSTSGIQIRKDEEGHERSEQPGNPRHEECGGETVEVRDESADDQPGREAEALAAAKVSRPLSAVLPSSSPSSPY